MSTKVINKLCLGTVQLGLNYGIANRKGRVGREAAFEILRHAYDAGITTFDTAYSYGESEKIIGEFIEMSECALNIISKLPTLGRDYKAKIEKFFCASLARLKIKSIYGYLIHRIDDFLKYNDIWDILEGFKKKGLVEKIGFSIYTVQELESLFDKKIDFDIVQVPYSIFDRRFEKYFKMLRSNNVEVHVRSLFLQGLAFLGPDNLPGNLAEAKGSLETLNRIALTNNVSINALCLNFVLLNPHIDKVIVGVDSLDHLKDDLANISIMESVRDIYDNLGELVIENEDILLPYKWSKR